MPKKVDETVVEPEEAVPTTQVPPANEEGFNGA